jgi:peptidoglycan hydrolase CwlO-like protein
MKKSMVLLMAMALFAVAAPVLAEEAHQHGASHHQHKDEQCAKECDMLLKDCAQEVDSINDRIRKLQVEINEKGATTYTRDELKILTTKLKEANELLKSLKKPH